MQRYFGFRFGYALLLLFASAVAGADGETVNSFLAETPETITPEYLARGKKNVQTVAAQLRTLFEPAPAVKSKKGPVRELPPEITIVKGPRDPGKDDGFSTLIYRCRYIQANRETVVAIENMLKSGAVEFHADQNLLTIYDRDGNIESIKTALLAIDRPLPQVLVEIKVVEVMFLDGMSRNLSVNFNDSALGRTATGKEEELTSSGGMTNPTLGSSTQAAGISLDWFPYVSGTENLRTSFQWVLTGQNAKILSSPNLVISRNEEASFATGQDIPIQELSTTSSGTNIATTFRRVGVTLTLEPMIINDQLVTLKVSPEVSNVQQYQRITQGGDSTTNQATTYQVPVISVRSLETTLTLHDGEVMMMGGLYSNRTSMQENRTPFLSDIPVIGELFTSKQREQELIQLVFFMRVHILKPQENHSGIIYDPDEVADTSNKIGDILQNSPFFPKLKTTIQQVEEEFILGPERRRQANNPEFQRELQESVRQENGVKPEAPAPAPAAEKTPEPAAPAPAAETSAGKEPLVWSSSGVNGSDRTKAAAPAVTPPPATVPSAPAGNSVFLPSPEAR